MKSLYILLVRTNTLFSRTIQSCTGCEFTHASLALDRELHQLYSFGRRSLYFPLNAGFVLEQIDKGVYRKNHDAPCVLYKITVKNQIYRRVKKEIRRMDRDYHTYRYNFLGIPAAWMRIPFTRQHHFLCSQFVARTLEKSGALPLPKHYSLIRPEDFPFLPGFTEIYRGPLAGCFQKDYLPPEKKVPLPFWGWIPSSDTASA